MRVAHAISELEAERPATPAAAALWRDVARLAADLEERAGSGASGAGLGAAADAAGAAAPVLCGQQAYVDYRLGMLAKLDALECCRPPRLAALVEYDAFASDRLHTRTDLPGVAPGGPERLSLIFHRGRRANARRDMRSVPPPSESTLAQIRADLRGAITLTARAVPGFDAAAAREQLDLLSADHALARERARSAGEFNLLWTARVLGRLGFDVPLIALGELWSLPSMRAVVARTLVPFLRNNAAFVEAANEAIERSPPGERGMAPRPPGHVPLMLTDARGVRRSLRVERCGEDLVLRADSHLSFKVNVGGGGEHELEEFLAMDGARCTPNVFAPIFLFQAGFAGIVNGAGAIRYAPVIASVLRRLFDSEHPPNLLCAGELPRHDAFAAARAAIPAPPADVEPGLVARLLAAGPAAVRGEIASVWRHDRR
jgi:hypothetical protein